MLRNALFRTNNVINSTIAAASSTYSGSSAKEPRKIPATGMTINPFALFIKENASEKKTSAPTVFFKNLTQQWKSLDEKQKNAYSVKSKQYREEKIKEFLNLSDEEQKKRVQEAADEKAERAKRKVRKARREEHEKTNRPEMPPNSYALFIKHEMQKLKDSGEAVAPVSKNVAKFASQWKEMSPGQKTEFVEKASALRSDYYAKLAEWNKNNGKEAQKPASK
ncbi:unnamed protein product [Caenorhabditis auriculariae]|uniref:HMG box domain-containing protein n=1 Tax=Caenorhabditis auriculariae TaxID=2777116 RepID=A0A8S1HV21_9PELO|nr:unnamed protein product [Caenorhabditis auriculariae]